MAKRVWRSLALLCSLLKLCSDAFSLPKLQRFGLSRRGQLALLAAAGGAPLKEAKSARAETGQAGQCVRSAILEVVRTDSQLAPTFLRLAFHDAATKRTGDRRRQGPNGSVRFELERNDNAGPTLKAALRALEPIVLRCSVSWADAIAIGGAAAVEALGGPKIEVRTGRVDATEADADGRLPDGTLTAGSIRDYFRQLGYSDEELVALAGSHTVGRWTSLNDVSSDCLAKDGSEFWICSRQQGRRLPFTSSPASFNSQYFRDVLEWERRQKLPKPTTRYKYRADDEKSSQLNLLPSDIGLLFDPGLHKWVERFAADEAAFFTAFSRAYIKLVT